MLGGRCGGGGKVASPYVHADVLGRDARQLLHQGLAVPVMIHQPLLERCLVGGIKIVKVPAQSFLHPQPLSVAARACIAHLALLGYADGEYSGVERERARVTEDHPRDA